MIQNHDTLPVENGGMQCPHCGAAIASTYHACAKCGQTLHDDDLLELSPTTTIPLSRKPSAHTKAPTDGGMFDESMSLILQVLPSGTCLTTQVSVPVVLGRLNPRDDREFCDLLEFSANQHGVSRQHCMLRRDHDRLLVSDLNSSNGTYLNGYPLPPLEERPVAHGDRLILGTLHLIVTFVTQ